MVDWISLMSEKLAEIEMPGYKSASTEFELLPNTFDELTVDAPLVFVTNAFTETNDDLDVLREKKRAMEPEDMIEKAHPEAVYTANALGDGGLVENQNEQQMKIIQMINKLPTGDHIHIYAKIITDLVKIAETIENINETACIEIDNVIAELHEELQKTAVIPFLAIGIGVLISTLGVGAYAAVRGTYENLKKDAQDLVDNISGWMNDAEYQPSRPLIDKLNASANAIVSLADLFLDATSKLAVKPSPALADRATKLDATMASHIQTLQSAAAVLKQQYSGIFGVDFIRTNGLVEDIAKQFSALHSQLQTAAANIPENERRKLPPPPGSDDLAAYMANPDKIPDQASKQGPGQSSSPAEVAVDDPDRIRELQMFISESFAPVKITGKLDYETKQRLVQIENQLNHGYTDQDGNKKIGLGVGNLPGNRLAELAKTSLTAEQLAALVNLFKTPSAGMSIPDLPEK